MRLILGCALAVCAADEALATAPLDDLFAGWAAAESRTELMVVEFDLETKDTVFDQRDRASGTFCLIRTKEAEVFASYELVTEKPTGERAKKVSALLNRGKVYLLNHDKKTAVRFEPTERELGPFLEKWFNPFVVLLDRKRAEARRTLEVVKQDEWYTYLAIKPKPVNRYGSVADNFLGGRLVLMRKDEKAVPKGMPRQLWHTDGIREYLFDIKAWRLNPAEGPKPEEFARPEDRPGWEVVDWPLRGNK